MKHEDNRETNLLADSRPPASATLTITVISLFPCKALLQGEEKNVELVDEPKYFEPDCSSGSLYPFSAFSADGEGTQQQQPKAEDQLLANRRKWPMRRK